MTILSIVIDIFWLIWQTNVNIMEILLGILSFLSRKIAEMVMGIRLWL